jgi:uncharacterized protein (TIGR02246 family)
MALTTEDQLAIQGLAARYNFAVDSGDGEAFAATFVEAGVLDTGPVQVEGRAALQEFADHFASTRRSPRHVSTNLVIDGDGDQATLQAYVLICALSGDPARPTIKAIGTYDDLLSKEDGTWRFVRRNFTPDA